MNLKNISEADIRLQEGNMGGLIDAIYIINKNDIDIFGIPALESSDPVTLTDLTLKNGKAFKKLYFTPNTGKLEEKIVGEEDGKSFEVMTEFSIPKLNKLSQELLSFVANGSFILVVKTSNNQLLVVGTPEIPAKYKDGGIETGAKYADKNNVKFGFIASSRFGAYYLPDGFDIGLLVESDMLNITLSPFSPAVNGNSTVMNLPLTWSDNTGETTNTNANDAINVFISHPNKGATYEKLNIGTRTDGNVGYLLTLYGISIGDTLIFEYWTSRQGTTSLKKTITKIVDSL